MERPAAGSVRPAELQDGVVKADGTKATGAGVGAGAGAGRVLEAARGELLGAHALGPQLVEVCGVHQEAAVLELRAVRSGDLPGKLQVQVRVRVRAGSADHGMPRSSSVARTAISRFSSRLFRMGSRLRSAFSRPSSTCAARGGGRG